MLQPISHLKLIARLFIFGSLAALSAAPSRALPVFARQFNVPCESCHTVAPALNANGLAFQASLFNWAAAEAAGKRKVLPLSAMATASRIENASAHQTTTDFRMLEVFAASGFTVAGDRRGGFFLDDTAVVKEERAGALDNAFIGLPIAGKRGELSMEVGQLAAMRYQWDALNSLTVSQPVVFGNAVDAFALGGTTPTVHLDYFDNRMKGTANGNYAMIGIPFEGRLSLNTDSRVGTSRGVVAHAFRRTDRGSIGVFGYTRDANSLYGVAATLTPRNGPTFLAAASTGHDAFGLSRLATLEAEQVISPQFAVTLRLDHREQPFLTTDTYPVAAITYYPPSCDVLRLSAEYSGADQAHVFSLLARAQF